MKTKIDLRVGRNAPCPCGSGKKFKRCCFTYSKWHSMAKSGQLVDDSNFLPADLPLQKVSGRVIYNDGMEARIKLPDHTAAFHRGPETEQEWNEQWAVGKVVELERFAWADLQEVQ